MLSGSGCRRFPAISVSLLIAIHLGVLAPSISAATFTVDRTDDEVAATGCTGAANDCSLRGAILAANAATGADIVDIPAGTYTLSIPGADENDGLTGDLDITGTVTIQGAGKNLTIVDGGGLDRVFHVGNWATAAISSLTVQNGYVDASDGGGGILSGPYGAPSLTLISVTVQNNAVAEWRSGGGVSAIGSLTLDGCTVCDNSAGDYGNGGGVLSLGGSLAITDSLICNNTGGGVYVSQSSPVTITDTTVELNTTTATNGGGGLAFANEGTSATVTRCVVAQNRAATGAGIWSSDVDSLIIEDSIISANGTTTGDYNSPEFTNFGGGIHGQRSTISITGSTLAGNLASEGGGVYFTDNVGADSMTIANSTLSGNAADDLGGGVYLSQGTAILSNVTIATNVANASVNYDGGGGGIYVNPMFGGTVTLRNSIVAGNSDDSDLWENDAPDCLGTLTSEGYNLLGDNSDCTMTAAVGDQIGTGAAPIDPSLGALASNGGPTQTHALNGSSPALDAANPAPPGSGGSACEASDQRGLARPLDGDSVPGAVCDIGAYEALTGAADLGVNAIDSEDPVNVGAAITYTVNITNSGPDEAVAVTLADDLDPATDYVSATPGTGTCSYSSGLHRVTCDLGNLAASASTSVTIEVTAPDTPQPLVSSVSLGSATPDPVSTDNSDIETTSVEVLIGPDLKVIAVDDADPVIIGDTVIYTLFVTNQGNDDADSVRLVDALPPSAVYLSSSTDPAGVYEGGEHTVTFDIGSMAVGATEFASVTLTAATDPRVMESFASATSTNLDLDNQNNGAIEETAVQAVSSAISAIVLSRTGEERCYDGSNAEVSCWQTGQDGEYRTGHPWPMPRFSDNGDGTMTDTLTGLMWLRDANCMLTQYPAFDNETGHFDDPGDNPDGEVFWSSALYFIDQINDGTYPNCGAGYADWRLPNVVELESLTNAGEPVPADWLLTQGFFNVEAMAYWTSTTKLVLSGDTNVAHVVSMSYGGVTSLQKSGATPSALPVWPVRGTSDSPAALWRTGQTASYASGDDGDIEAGTEWPAVRFSDNLDGTVDDALTGLTWLADADALETAGITPRTWTEALAFVAELNAGNHPSVNTGGHTDWRLPNKKEMMSLLDFSGHPLRLPAGNPFTNVPPETGTSYWTSTPGNLTDRSWLVELYGGSVWTNFRTTEGHVWPVRGGFYGSVISDDDGDGVPDDQEMGPGADDPTYDGNEDGVPDIVQANVGSTSTGVGDAYVTLASGPGTTLGNIKVAPNPSPHDAPEVDFPFGFFDFTVGDITVGGCTTVTLYLPLDASLATYFKYGPEPGVPADHWYQFLYDGTTGAEIFHDATETRIVLHLCDGQRGDDDLLANGTVEDIGGPGTHAAEIFSDGFEGGDTSRWSTIVPGP